MKTQKWCLLSVLALVGCSGSPAAAFSDEPLITDRPDATESAVTVPAGSVQIEMGYEYIKEADGAGHTATYPNVLFRYGLSEKIELRFEGMGWSRNNQEARTFFNDTAVGAKVQIGDRDAERPQAVLLSASLPTGDKAVSSGRTDFGVIYATSMEPAEGHDLGFNFGAFYDYTDQKRRWSGSFTTAYGAPLSGPWGYFVEFQGIVHEKDKPEPYLNGGVTLELSGTSQADLFLSVGLGGSAAHHIIGIGYSFRN